LGRFDRAPQQPFELGFVRSGDAGGLRLGDEIRQAIEPDGFVQG
jgi:hypothetical protein